MPWRRAVLACLAATASTRAWRAPAPPRGALVARATGVDEQRPAAARVSSKSTARVARAAEDAPPRADEDDDDDEPLPANWIAVRLSLIQI